METGLWLIEGEIRESLPRPGLEPVHRFHCLVLMRGKKKYISAMSVETAGLADGGGDIDLITTAFGYYKAEEEDKACNHLAGALSDVWAAYVRAPAMHAGETRQHARPTPKKCMGDCLARRCSHFRCKLLVVYGGGVPFGDRYLPRTPGKSSSAFHMNEL